MSERQRKWDLRYLKLAQEVGDWSKDPSTKVGAVLVRPDNSVASTGFNGFPPGHDDHPDLYADRDYKYQHVVHAEVNALNFYEKTPLGFTLYTSFPCCPDCMEAAGKAGIMRVVGPPLPGARGGGKTEAWENEWRKRIMESAEVAARWGISWEVVDG